MFRTSPLSIIRSFALYTLQWHISYRFADSLRAPQAPDDGQRNCPKHVEFYSKNKIEKFVNLFGFITRIHHDERSPEPQISRLFSRYPSQYTCNSTAAHLMFCVHILVSYLAALLSLCIGLQ